MELKIRGEVGENTATLWLGRDDRTEDGSVFLYCERGSLARALLRIYPNGEIASFGRDVAPMGFKFLP